jgi:ribosomal-protein-alanine N-acetyltransferase
LEGGGVPDLTITRMYADDVPEVMEVDRHCFRTPWSENAYRSELKNASAYYLVARLEGSLVGFAGAWLVMDEAHITTLGVHPVHRGRKIGERLLAGILAEAIQRGVRRASLEVRETNEKARHLYEKYGFTPVARRRGYYSDNSEDAVVMWIDNLTSPRYQELFAERVAALSRIVAQPVVHTERCAESEAAES